MVSLQSLIQFFKEEWIRFKNLINAEKMRQQLIDSFKGYVPQYYRRTPDEHAALRARVAGNPATCTHLKGFRRRRAVLAKDYNVSLHRFIDGTQRVRCLSCGKKWFETDADWPAALDMVELSSNSPSSSEAPAWYIKSPTGKTLEYKFLDGMKRDYPDWDCKATPQNHDKLV